MFIAIDHIGVAVRDLNQAADNLEEILGLKVAEQEEVEDQQLLAALVPTADMRFELMQPTSPESVVGRFLDRRGEGIHHICFEVSDIEAEIEALKNREVQLVQGSPREGFVGSVEFIHPRSANGVLVEIAQVNLRTPNDHSIKFGHLEMLVTDPRQASDSWIRNFEMTENMTDISNQGSTSQPPVWLNIAGLQVHPQLKFSRLDTQLESDQGAGSRSEGLSALVLRTSALMGIPFFNKNTEGTDMPLDKMSGMNIVLEQY